METNKRQGTDPTTGRGQVDKERPGTLSKCRGLEGTKSPEIEKKWAQEPGHRPNNREPTVKSDLPVKGAKDVS